MKLFLHVIVGEDLQRGIGLLILMGIWTQGRPLFTKLWQATLGSREPFPQCPLRQGPGRPWKAHP